MDFPIEVWIHVFEQLTHDSHYARPIVVGRFVDAKKWHVAQGLEITAFDNNNNNNNNHVMQLPAFELKAYKATIPYYGINKRSRAAAEKLGLTAHLLKTCTPPLRILPFGELDHEQKITLKTQRTTAITSGRVVLEMYNPEALREFRGRRMAKLSPQIHPQCADAFVEGPLPLIDAMHSHFAQLQAAANDPGFTAVSKIDVLTYHQFQPGCEMMLLSVPRKLEGLVQNAFKAAGRSDGKLTLWED